MSGDFSLWVYLAKTPLLWLTVTLTAYVLADRSPPRPADIRSPIRC